MATDPRIFKATYSNVPVYEMMCNDIAVMRRRSDSYLNATQILKVAEFDKPQRTRILEREVQTGLHEKVQGGYGKYQGTWVPFERGVALAQQFNVHHLLQPIFDFVKGDESPPMAPKHVSTATAATRTRKTREPRRKRAKYEDTEGSEADQSSQYSDTIEVEDLMLPELARSRTPSPLVRSSEKDTVDERPARATSTQRVQRRPRAQARDPEGETDGEIEDHNMSYAQKLLQHFVSGNPTVPRLLQRPPRDLDVNVVIDDEGHTSLHWAAAMGQLDAVQALIDLDVDIYRVNYKGQTALMRSVLFTNNFDKKTFNQLLVLLQKTIFNIDKKDQTVFHHVSLTASWKGKAHASRYYMECLIDKLASNRSELISILNVQDVYGDTALTIAARVGNKKLVRLLIDAGASPEIANEEGMAAQDYLSEAEHATQPPQGLLVPSSSSTDDSIILGDEQATRARLRKKTEEMFKLIMANEKAVPSVSEVFDGFADSYERDLAQKEHAIKAKRIELDLAQKRLQQTQTMLNQIQLDADKLQEVTLQSRTLQDELRRLMYHSQKDKLTRLLHNHCTLDTKSAEKKQPGNQDSHETNVPTQESSNSEESDLHQTLQRLQTNRAALVDEVIRLKCEIPGKRYQDYKRLISMCCNVAYENVDVMLSPLLASFDEADSCLH